MNLPSDFQTAEELCLVVEHLTEIIKRQEAENAQLRALLEEHREDSL